MSYSVPATGLKLFLPQTSTSRAMENNDNWKETLDFGNSTWGHNTTVSDLLVYYFREVKWGLLWLYQRSRTNHDKGSHALNSNVNVGSSRIKSQSHLRGFQRTSQFIG